MPDDDSQAKAKAAAEAKVRLAFSPPEKAKTRLKIAPRDPTSPNMFCRPVGAHRGQVVAQIAVDARPSGRRARRKGRTLLRPVHPNAGLTAIYRRKILELVDGMQAETMRLIKRTYQMNPPKAALDATPADQLRAVLNEIARRWQYNFDVAAPLLAEYFATAVHLRTDAALKSALRQGGFSVEFSMTPAVRDILGATIEANVGLIKSIPQEYLTQVQGMVMRSVQTGRDAGQLYADIREQFGVTRRRAALIARDQNAKATSAIHTARQKEAGITHAIWMHSGGGRHPRPTHVAMNGNQYEVSKGMYDSSVDKWIFPGELINCRCVMRSVIPGFD